MLMVGANSGLIGMSKEHLAIALALSVPVIVCITKVCLLTPVVAEFISMFIVKIDMTPANIVSKTVKQVSKILESPGCR